MRLGGILAAGILALATTPAHAAAPSHAASLAGAIGILAKPLEEIPFARVGTLGNVSLSTFPLLNPKLPLLGKGLPVVSTVTIKDGVIIVQSISVLQKPLPGLGALDAVLSGLGKH